MMNILLKIDNKITKELINEAYVKNNRLYLNGDNIRLISENTGHLHRTTVDYAFIIRELYRKGSYDLSYMTFVKLEYEKADSSNSQKSNIISFAKVG